MQHTEFGGIKTQIHCPEISGPLTRRRHSRRYQRARNPDPAVDDRPRSMTTVHLRRLIDSLDNGVWGNEPLNDGTDTVCIRAADFDFIKYRAAVSSAPLRQVSPYDTRRRSLRPGDIVLEKSGGGERQPVGRAVLYDSETPAVCSNFAARLRARDGVDSRYLTYLLAALYYEGATARCVLQTTGIQNLDTDAWLQTGVPPTALDEQRRIADFLDDQVARIDNIIAARTVQLGLIVSELDASWDEAAMNFRSLVSLRRFLESITDGPFGSALTSSHYAEQGTRVVRLGNIGLAEFREDDKAYVPDSYAAQLAQHAVRAGDVLMAGLGDERWPLGRAVVAPADLGPAIVKADCYRLRFSPRLSAEFAAWYLSSPPARMRFAELARGSTRARLNTQLAREALIPDASHAAQQEALVTFSGARSAAHRKASALARSAALLGELKRSLITAAVWGEFDVSSADGSRVVA
jgi:type I restriction enzyme S subunit